MLAQCTLLVWLPAIAPISRVISRYIMYAQTCDFLS